MSKILGIDYFGHKLPFARLHSQTTLKVRRKVYDFLKHSIGEIEGKAFLEHGATPNTTREASNCFIHWLIEDGAKVYATSPENIVHLEQVFPKLTVLSWPPELSSLSQIDYIISSAVIEHVGSESSQIDYVTNLLQLHPKILITTPNRYHWLEFHTKIPLLHWLPRSWHRQLLRGIGLTFWGSENNLRLLSRKDLLKIIQKAARINDLDVNLTCYYPRFLGMVSNLCVLITDGKTSRSARNE